MTPRLLRARVLIPEESGALTDETAVVKLSATRLKTFQQCPRQYRYRYVEQLPSVMTGALAFGQVIHRVLHNLESWRQLSGDPLCESLALYEFTRLWGEALATEKPVFKDEGDLLEYSALARLMLLGYLEAQRDAEAQRESPSPYKLEHHFDLLLEDEDGAPVFRVEGVIDRIEEDGDGTLAIIDYKTGQRKPSPRQVASDVQLLLYAAAVPIVFGRPVIRTTYYHLRDGTQLSCAPDEDMSQRLFGETLPAVASDIAAERFPACSGYWCRFCDYQQPCLAEGGSGAARYVQPDATFSQAGSSSLSQPVPTF